MLAPAMHETVQIRRLRAMAERHGWLWLGEPESGFCGRLKIGRHTRFVIGADIGVNSSGAARIAGDKAFAQYFLTQAGLPTIPTRLLHSLAEAEAIAEFPVLLKPNTGHGGAAVSIVGDRTELAPAYAAARQFSPLVLAQPVVRQREFRIVVFDRRPLLAYEKEPLIVVGDGRRTIRELLLSVFQADRRVERSLQFAGLTWDAVLPAAAVFRPLPIANLSAGGTWRECLAELSPAVLGTAVSAADSLGLTMAGIDLFADAPDSASAVVNEVNASPGLERLAEHGALLDPLFAAIEAYLIDYE